MLPQEASELFTGELYLIAGQGPGAGTFRETEVESPHQPARHGSGGAIHRLSHGEEEGFFEEVVRLAKRFKVAVIHDFAFALIVGVVVGTYSSIFVASPVLIAWEAKFSSPRVRAKGKR